jgi:Kef-type K+ transport system membrane component KefB
MKKWIQYSAIALLFFPILAIASSNAQHNDPVASVILGVTLLLFCGIVGRYIAGRLNQPKVLGELLMGVFIGNVAYLFGSHLIVILRESTALFAIVQDVLHGIPLNEAITSNIPNSYYSAQVLKELSSSDGTDWFNMAYAVDIFSRYGIIFLLFMVGLESSVEELLHTGKESLRVAIIGVIVPILLGFAVAYLLLPQTSFNAHLFIGATLCATSIGITASVLKEMGTLKTREAKTILGAAMIDDILGLIILAIVSGVVINQAVDIFMVSQIIILSILFFAAVLYIGPFILKKAVRYTAFLELWEAKLLIAFIFLMLLSWIASKVQLATIIGAFAAGLVLDDKYFSERDHDKTKSISIKKLISPLESTLAPLFFVLIGLQVKLETFLDLQVLYLAFGLIIAAILGKLICGLGANSKDDRLLIGIGMLPRGEVGLVFASIGRTLGVITDTLFSAIILMIIVTTFMAPPLLKFRWEQLEKRGKKR